MPENKKNRDYNKISAWVAIIALIVAVVALLFGEGILWRIKGDDSNSDEDSIIEPIHTTGDYKTHSESTEDITTDLDDGQIIIEDEKDILPDIVPLSDISGIYQNSKIDISVFNASEFSLCIDVKALSMKYNGKEREMGIHPAERIPVSVYLIDYDSKEQVEVQTQFLGETFVFSNISDGTYFYVAESKGYKTTYPSNPFILKRDDSKEKQNLPWIVSMEKSDSSCGDIFRIKLTDLSGNAMKRIKTNVRVVDLDDPNPSAFTSIPVTTNEEGFLTMWENVNGRDYYYIIDFSTSDGFGVQVQNSNNEFQNVQFDSLNEGIIIY